MYVNKEAGEPAVKLSSQETFSLLKLVAPTCDDYMVVCLWKQDIVECKKHLQLVPTDIGYCCSFNIEIGKSADLIEETEDHHENSLTNSHDVHTKYNDAKNCKIDDEDWNKENGCPYTDGDSEICLSRVDIGKEFMQHFCEEHGKLPDEHKDFVKVKTVVNQTVLKTVAKAGMRSGFTFLFDSLRCETIGKLDFYGLKMLVHHPQEFPKVGEKGFPVTVEKETFVAMEAEVLESAPDVIKEDPVKRNCLFPHEKNLTYYNKYSKPRCEIECKIPVMVRSCGCAPYFLPGSHPVCPAEKAACVEEVDEHPEVIGCAESCLSSCSDILYHATVSSGKFPSKEPGEVLILERGKEKNPSVENKDYVKDVMGMVHVYFKDDSVKKYSRSLRYSTIDLISSVGGTMGLCLGFSLVSVVELIYFGTIRR